MIFFCVMLIAQFLGLIVQQFIPPVAMLEGARVLLLPILFFYGALAFPFPVMLLLAFFSGFMWDALTVYATDSAVEISLGWSIILFAVLGAIMNGFRPLFQRGRWEIHCLVSGVCTALIVLTQYLMITFRRGDFAFPTEIWWRIGGAGLIALVLSPILFFLLNRLALLTGYVPQPHRNLLH